MDPFGLVDKEEENKSREITQEYLNFLDDAVIIYFFHHFKKKF